MKFHFKIDDIKKIVNKNKITKIVLSKAKMKKSLKN